MSILNDIPRPTPTKQVLITTSSGIVVNVKPSQPNKEEEKAVETMQQNLSTKLPTDILLDEQPDSPEQKA